MEKKNMVMIALALALFVLSSDMLEMVESAASDCLDACQTSCVQSNTRLMQRCERKCQIRCDPGLEAEEHLH